MVNFRLCDVLWHATNPDSAATVVIHATICPLRSIVWRKVSASSGIAIPITRSRSTSPVITSAISARITRPAIGRPPAIISAPSLAAIITSTIPVVVPVSITISIARTSVPISTPTPTSISIPIAITWRGTVPIGSASASVTSVVITPPGRPPTVLTSPRSIAVIAASIIPITSIPISISAGGPSTLFSFLDHNIHLHGLSEEL
mmetsp:Transcript_10015/g.22458  ORF Transcript_10015/g.22458 Transcript_10015/m.22458 type:complete len:204 (+) Transcript_10015:597-1208(+)